MKTVNVILNVLYYFSHYRHEEQAGVVPLSTRQTASRQQGHSQETHSASVEVRTGDNIQ